MKYAFREVNLVIDNRESEYYILEPCRSYILKLQYVKIPPDLLPADVEFRSSFHRCGWVGKVTNIDPGFEGHIYVLLTPTPSASRLVIEKGARVVQMRLYKLSEPLRGYSGQWRGV
jgi:deoxycytidine triphosphate deaminase